MKASEKPRVRGTGEQIAKDKPTDRTYRLRVIHVHRIEHEAFRLRVFEVLG